MDIKKSLIIFLCIAMLLPLVIAQEYTLDIETFKDVFKAKENISLMVTIYDSNNNLVDGEVFVTLEDAEKRVKIEKTIPSNEFVEVDLGEGASYGQGKITATYQGSEASGFFTIEIEELIKFSLIEDNLIIKNIGNTKYVGTIRITIGESPTTNKEIKLNIGEKISYKLVAPEGAYNIKVTDGKTTLNKQDVQLTGTGKVVGVLEEKVFQPGITSSIRDEETTKEFISYLKQSKFVYVFIFAIIGLVILLAIERRYRKRI